MKSYTLDPSVLSMDGRVKSPAITMAGDASLDCVVTGDAGGEGLNVEGLEPDLPILNALVGAEPMPAPPANPPVSGGTNEPTSQYSTIGPVPK